jgi:hypothetical protein
VCCSMLQYVAVCCSGDVVVVLGVEILKRQLAIPFNQEYVVCCSVLQCGEVCCRMLQYVAVVLGVDIQSTYIFF